MTIRALPAASASSHAQAPPETPATGVTLLDSKGRSVAVRASPPGEGASNVPAPAGSRLDALRKASDGLGAAFSQPKAPAPEGPPGPPDTSA